MTIPPSRYKEGVFQQGVLLPQGEQDDADAHYRRRRVRRLLAALLHYIHHDSVPARVGHT